MSRVDTLYLIHHSHTDVGYTHDQPIVWDLHGRFIEAALRLADRYSGSDSDGAFRWTVENTGVLYEWLKHAPADQVERFVALERQGRIEVTGMFANLTPLLDVDQLIESFRLVRKLRDEYGFTITHAMNCDVNGENWPLVDLLLDAGIEGFTMAINTHFGGAPLHRPDVFWWEGPSGRRILAYNGWTYDTGWRYGIGHSAESFEREWWPRVEQRLEEVNYPLPVVMAQSYHPFGDNGPAFEGFSTFIDEWNASGKSPRIVMATPNQWWSAVKQHAERLPTACGDWTDFWNFGSASSAREVEINRNSRSRLRAADGLAAATLGLKNPLPTLHLGRVFQRYRDDAWQALNLWDEHTWGADVSIRAPESEDTLTQWYHKANYAHLARSLSMMLRRDAIADLARYIQRNSAEDVLLFNPLPWPRIISGEVPYHVSNPRGTPDDATAGRHSQDRIATMRPLLIEHLLSTENFPLQIMGVPPTQVPGYGYTIIPRSSLVALQPGEHTDAAVIETGRWRLEFDTRRGGLRSWYDKRLEREWVDQSSPYAFNGFVHEEVADKANPLPRKLMFQMEWDSPILERPSGWKTGWQANRTRAEKVLLHQVHHTPLGWEVIQVLQGPGEIGRIIQRTHIPETEAQGDAVEFESWWTMGVTPHAESTYLLFPFNLSGATPRLDLGGQAMTPGKDQIPGVCMDYFTAQNWVDFSDGQVGVTVAVPENPMVQFGDFHFGHNQRAFHLERATLLGWVTNNYWETNFRPYQAGEVHARYIVRPYQGAFDETAAHRFGMEAANTRPLLQHLGEPPAEPRFPPSRSLLQLPEMNDPQTPVLTLHVKPAWDGRGVIVRLLNTGAQPAEAALASGLLQIQSAQVCDLLENPREALQVQGGTVRVNTQPRRVTTLMLELSA